MATMRAATAEGRLDAECLLRVESASGLALFAFVAYASGEGRLFE